MQSQHNKNTGINTPLAENQHMAQPGPTDTPEQIASKQATAENFQKDRTSGSYSGDLDDGTFDNTFRPYGSGMGR